MVVVVVVVVAAFLWSARKNYENQKVFGPDLGPASLYDFSKS